MQKKIFTITLIILGLITTNFAQLYITPRSLSLADAYTTQARGAEVFGWNPANLGLSGNPKFSLDYGIIPLVPFPMLQLSNNSISPNLLYNHFFTGKYLDTKDKEELLNYFPDNGLVFNPLVQMRLLNLSIKSWAITLGIEVTGKVVAPKELFHFAFFGNEFGEPIDLSKTDLQLQSVATVGLAHGWQMNNIPFIKDHVEQFAVGMSAKALLGLGYAGFEDLTAKLTTYTDKVVAQGNLFGKAGIGGVGFALDLGAAAQINKRLSAGLALNNLFGFINWDLGPTKVIHYSIDLEIPSDQLEKADSLLEASLRDTSYGSSAFTTNYPAYLLLGGEYRVFDNLKVMASYRQAFSRDFAMDVVPMLSTGVEYRPLNWLPLRFGLAFGGNERFKWSFGSGLNFNHWRLDWGFAQIGGFFNHGTGLAFCLNQSLVF